MDEVGVVYMCDLWGFDVLSECGLMVVEVIDVAHVGDIDVLYLVGGNFLEILLELCFV